MWRDPRWRRSRAQPFTTQGKDAVMVRNGLFVSRCAVLLWALPCLSGLVRGEEVESRLRTQLAVQSALQQGRDSLQRGEYQAAVYALEKEIARVDGNRDYMNALREAYRGYIRELQHTNRADEARIYQERLKILDPACQIDGAVARASAPPTLASIAAESGTTSSPPVRPTAAYTARPQMPEEQDPFADSNRAAPASAREVIERARREYDAKNYTTANRLYEEANRLDSHAVAPFREFWAFCKLYAVTEAVNKAGWVPPADAEKEALAALALSTAPELQRQGKDLLRAIQDRHVEFHHVPAQGQRWAEVQTANFRVIYHESRQRAEEVARVAETTRSAMIRKWFGEEPTAWDSKCLIFLYPTAEFYARQTRQPLDSPGHTSLIAEKERLVERRMYLHCDVADMLTHVLPHETTHAVLMGRFGRHLVPRWADEGIAILSEPREKIERYLKNLPALRSQHDLFSASQLMSLKDYPESRRVTAFYVQSISLVEFLCAQKGGPQAFTRFVRAGLQDGYETALRRTYGIRDFKELEERWSQAAADNSSSRAALYRPRK
jgi:hypothetical protein